MISWAFFFTCNQNHQHMRFADLWLSFFRIFSVCPLTPSLVGAYYLHPHTHVLFSHSGLLRNCTWSITGGAQHIGGGGAQTEKISFFSWSRHQSWMIQEFPNSSLIIPCTETSSSSRILVNIAQIITRLMRYSKSDSHRKQEFVRFLQKVCKPLDHKTRIQQELKLLTFCKIDS